jgi:hypothetical protein
MPTGLSAVDWLPGGDVLERFREVEVLQGVVEHDAETVAREFRHLAGREPGGFLDQGMVEGRVIPPVGGDRAEFTRHDEWSNRRSGV